MIFKDKIVLVTGATGGIGTAIAQEFTNAGATLVITGRDKSKLDSLAAQIGNNTIAIATDLNQTDAAEKLVVNIIEKTGHIDVLINNAGLTHDALLMRMSDDQFDEVMSVNLRAPFKLCRACITPMMKNKHGRIINISSIVGYIGGPGQVNYAASKGALVAMTKSIAAEVGSRGITANCVAPGFIETPMTDGLSEELKKTYLAQIPAGRFGEPKDVANACLFLASEEASYINGQTLHVNGGMGRF